MIYRIEDVKDPTKWNEYKRDGNFIKVTGYNCLPNIWVLSVFKDLDVVKAYYSQNSAKVLKEYTDKRYKR